MKNIAQTQSKTVVFIHGLFMNNHTWDGWKVLFEQSGYTCYAPAHPKHAGQPAALRANPPKGLADIQFQDWLSQLEAFIDSLPEKPILVGHSFGGLTAQKLVASGRAEAAILISSAPPKGISTFKWDFIRANLKVINPFKGKSIFNPQEAEYKRWFHFAITNTLSKGESDALFDQFAVPESRETPRAATQDIASIDTATPHVPLLFVGGLEDVIVPNVLLQKTVDAYTDPNSIVDSTFYAGKDHFICGAPGWQEVAENCLNWLSKVLPEAKFETQIGQ
ncbi:alpha/beta hydrolase [Pontibacter sp. G13]|uniref:alpha/beta hydrolase n=1 Tax=Pontibacter sp. G13 TaxID=3074898 RepID=UPI00288A1648|nr:alpha/beta hydrolase [Pontibacter sp. G13]WNJ18010.1 alpha/beta hydrolase [Pontibacter sp. G13]